MDTSSMLSSTELNQWKNRLCLWVSVSRKFSYIVHLGRYRGGQYIKETGKSSRYHTQEEAWEDVFSEEDSSILGEKPYVFTGLIPETTNWYSICDMIVAERELAELTNRVFVGEKHAYEIHCS